MKLKSNRSLSTVLLLISAFSIATAGLGYEIISGTIAGYLLGDSATQFSLTIGIYLFAMGIGSYLSRYIQKSIVEIFINIEFIVGLLGGLSALILYYCFNFVANFHVVLCGILLFLGCLVGIEIPLLLRILKNKLSFEDLISKVLALDYIGSLLAAIAIPLFFAERIGFINTALVFGLLNLIVALTTIYIFRDSIAVRKYFMLGIVCLTIIIIALLNSKQLTHISERHYYPDRIALTKQSKYQRIVVTKGPDRFSLFLNRNLQFNSSDEYRYHEALVHPIMAGQIEKKKSQLKALILGGGDAMAARELLRYKEIEKITIIELDREIIRLARQNPWFKEQNKKALFDKRVKLVYNDAFVWLKTNKEKYDVIIIDFPDPGNFSLGKLYSTVFYKRIQNSLAIDGYAVTQSTSPFFARRAFWCIEATINSTGFYTAPYHLYVPSFGEWGFIIFGHLPFQKAQKLPNLKFRFLNIGSQNKMFQFGKDIEKIEVKIQTLNTQHLVQYYNEDWTRSTR